MREATTIVNLRCQGCGTEFTRKDWQIRHGKNRGRFCSRRCINTVAVVERFWTKVDRRTDSECWVWTAAAKNGYGIINRSPRQRTFSAHRLSWELAHGEPVPAGLEIDHLCKNTLCVNPAHLEAVTQRENTLRSDNFIAQHVRATHCPQGHPYAGENLFVDKSGRRKCRTCRRVRTNVGHRKPADEKQEGAE